MNFCRRLICAPEGVHDRGSCRGSSQYCCDTKRGCGTDTLKIELVSATAGYDESLGGPIVVIKAAPAPRRLSALQFD
jgi:hypothetical protein